MTSVSHVPGERRLHALHSLPPTVTRELPLAVDEPLPVASPQVLGGPRKPGVPSGFFWLVARRQQLQARAQQRRGFCCNA